MAIRSGRVRINAGGSSGGGGAPSGSAGGDLTGTYPNPTIGTGKVTSTAILDGTILNADVNASAAIAYSKLALTGAVLNADLAGSIAASKISGTAVTAADTGTVTSTMITDATITGTDIASATVAVGNMTAASLERAFILGKAGAIGATETDAADFPFCVPFNCTIVRMKATLGSAATGAMIVQLRTAAQPITTAPAMGNVSSVLVTFANTNVLATATGFSTTLTEGDFLNFSCSTGSGTSLLVEVVVKLR